MELTERAEQLASELIAPLVAGGTIELGRPFGHKLARELGVERHIVDDETRVRVDNARIRIARSVAPIDVLPPLSVAEWAMAAALNDLLQVSNHELSGFATRSRHEELLRSVVTTCAQVPNPATLEEAVARHGTFANLLDIARTDTNVSWWTGSESFRGEAPPARLLIWPERRRVHQVTTQVNITQMDEGVPVTHEQFAEGLSALLRCTPLTDLATCMRPHPRFVWTSSSLSLVAHVNGRNLALRALEHEATESPTPFAEDLEMARRNIHAASAHFAQGTAPYAAALGFYQALTASIESWDAAGP